MADVINPHTSVMLATLDPDASGVSAKPAFVTLSAPDPLPGAATVVQPLTVASPTDPSVSPVADVLEMAGDEDEGASATAASLLGELTGVPREQMDARDVAQSLYDELALGDAAAPGAIETAASTLGGSPAGLAREDERASNDSGSAEPADLKSFAGFGLATRMGVTITVPEEEEADAFSFTGLTTEAAPADAPLDPFSDVIDAAWADELADQFQSDGFGAIMHKGGDLLDARTYDANTVDITDPSLQAPMPDGWVV